MMKAYPPFINFFEFSKETVEKCDKQKPRFHAFLKISHSKPECSRQTLTELLIRPVQRLPSMILLLTGMLNSPLFCLAGKTAIRFRVFVIALLHNRCLKKYCNNNI